MKFTSSLVATASGKLGGLVFSRNRYGQYTRRLTMPVNPATTAQQVVRNAFGTLASSWLTVLSLAQRNLWNVYAANVPKTDALGASINITGENWYIACNVLRIQAGLPVINAAPTVFSQAALTIPVPTPTVGGGVSIVTSHAFTNTDAWAIAVGGALLIYESIPQSASHSFFKGPYRFVGSILGAVVPPASPASKVNPVSTVSGQKLFYRYVAIQADARISPSVFQSAIV